MHGLIREGVIQEEWLNVRGIGSLFVGPIRKTTKYERTLSQRHGEVLDAGEKFRISRACRGVGVLLVANPSFNAKEASTRLDSLLADRFPTGGDEVGLIAEKVILARYGTVDLKSAMLIKAECRPERIRYAAISTTDSIFTYSTC